MNKKIEIKSVVQYQDLVNLGFTVGASRNLIKQAKHVMVRRGFDFYNNKRLGTVPLEVVEEILGTKIA